MDVEILSRIQFAFTIAFHYIYPPLSIGLGVALVVMEGLWLKTRNVRYHNMARFWTKIFGLTFAIGVATGIVMEFEFGTNWATYSRFVGDVFGSPLAMEGIYAFFLESGFLALLLFGWDKVGPYVHFFATCMVCLGAHFSAVWIVVANSWMQTPAGYQLARAQTGADGNILRDAMGRTIEEPLPAGYIPGPEDLYTVRAVITDFWGMVFNPSSVDRLTHTLIGAWLAGAFLIISVSAYYLIKRRHERFARTSLKIGLGFAAAVSLLQLVSGHSSAKVVAEHQPVKLAAMEGLFETREAAPLHLFGWVDEENNDVIGPALPGMLSFLVHNTPEGTVQGLNDPELARMGRPPVQATFQLFHLMVAIGFALIAVSWGGLLLWWRGVLFDPDSRLGRAYLWVLVVSVLGPQIANQAGWFTAEIGRQPWIVYGLMKTSDGISRAISAEQVVFSLILFALIYLLLFVVFIYLLDRKIKHGPSDREEGGVLPEKWQRTGLGRAVMEAGRGHVAGGGAGEDAGEGGRA